MILLRSANLFNESVNKNNNAKPGFISYKNSNKNKRGFCHSE